MTGFIRTTLQEQQASDYPKLRTAWALIWKKKEQKDISLKQGFFVLISENIRTTKPYFSSKIKIKMSLSRVLLVLVKKQDRSRWCNYIQSFDLIWIRLCFFNQFDQKFLLQSTKYFLIRFLRVRISINRHFACLISKISIFAPKKSILFLNAVLYITGNY